MTKKRMTSTRGKKLSGFILALAVVTDLLGSMPAAAQTQTPPTRVLVRLSSMSPEERVGQLFLVTFRGTNTGSDSQIYDLIVNHHAGGVVLLAENDNILDQPDTVAAARDLTVALQTIASDSSQNSFEPLFVGISQDGNGAPNDQLLSGLTSLPSQMAIGATWDPSQAHEVGNVLGGELSGLGFNLIFDPSLDVVEDPHPRSSQVCTRGAATG